MAAEQNPPQEAQHYLEAVFAVNPLPDDFVRFRLHTVTGLTAPFIDAWFEARRNSSRREEASPKACLGVGNSSTSAHHSASRTVASPFPLFEPQAPSAQEHSPADSQENTRFSPEVLDIGRCLAMLQKVPNDGSLSKVMALDHAKRLKLDAPFDPLRRSSPPTAGAEPEGVSNTRKLAADTRLSERVPSSRYEHDSDMSTEDTLPVSGERFTEADLELVSQLVGLQTISSVQEHCGSRSLFMFEQLTALDSLEPYSGQGAKRRRTRHQHFWRNTDKLDRDERVYVPTSAIKPALKHEEPVMPKSDISVDERTNAWTVCLTSRGVVNYLNKKISPLGVRLVRALQNSAHHAGQAHRKQKVAMAWGPARDTVRNKVWQESAHANPALDGIGADALFPSSKARRTRSARLIMGSSAEDLPREEGGPAMVRAPNGTCAGSERNEVGGASAHRSKRRSQVGDEDSDEDFVPAIFRRRS